MPEARDDKDEPDPFSDGPPPHSHPGQLHRGQHFPPTAVLVPLGDTRRDGGSDWFVSARLRCNAMASRLVLRLLIDFALESAARETPNGP